MRVIVFPGVGDKGMLQGVTRQLPGVEVITLPYGSYGPVPLPFGVDHEASLLRLMRDGRAELDKGPAILLGYSQGAEAAGNVAAGGHPNLVGVGLVADPMQPDPGTGRWGIRGQRRIPGVKVSWAYEAKDVICQCPKDSPLRTFADQTARLTFSKPDAWIADLFDRLVRGRWQAVKVQWWNPLAVLRQYNQAQFDAEGYLFRGDHTVAYTRGAPSQLDRLADTVRGWM